MLWDVAKWKTWFMWMIKKWLHLVASETCQKKLTFHSAKIRI